MTPATFIDDGQVYLNDEEGAARHALISIYENKDTSLHLLMFSLKGITSLHYSMINPD